MALTSTLGSPGIEIREVDNSYRLDSSTATTVYIPGFTSQGPVDEVMSVSTIEDFETIYGTPTNAAERYFYYTVKAVLDNSGNGVTVLTSRLPYGSGKGDTVSNAYTLLAYPAVPVIKKVNSIADGGNTIKVTADFDQFQVVTGTQKTNFANLFKISPNTNGSSPITAKVQDYCLTLDQDIHKTVTSATGLSIKAFKSNNLTVPPVDKMIDFSTLTSVAPEIIFQIAADTTNTLKANGTVATEVKSYKKQDVVYTETHAYFAYTIYKTVNNQDKKVGSMFVHVIYENDVTSGTKYFINQDSTNVPFQKIDAFEVAASYQGQTTTQYSSNTKTEASQLTDDVTYVLGSPATFQISLNEYYKLITGESLKWSRIPYTFSGTTSSKKGENFSTDKVKSETAFGLLEAIGHSAFIAINTSRSIINNNFEGFYLGLTDNMFVNPSDDYKFDAITKVKITTETYDASQANPVGLLDSDDDTGDFHSLNANRLSFYLDSNYQGSVSRVLTRNITAMDISSKEYDDTISMGLFKLSKSTTSNDILKLNYNLREKYNWSFGKSRLKSSAAATRPVSYFAENVIENSNNITLLINPFIAEKAFVDTDGVLHGKIRVHGQKLLNNLKNYGDKYLRRDYTDLYSNSPENVERQKVNAIVASKLAKSSILSWKTLSEQAGVSADILENTLTGTNYKNFVQLNALIPFGTYAESTNKDKVIGNVPAKLERALSLVENDEEYPDIDIVLEGGLGTIYSYTTGVVPATESATTATTLLIDEGNDDIPAEQGQSLVFDDTVVLEGIEDLRTGRTTLSDAAQSIIEDYRDVQNVFTNFANSMQNGGRGDTFYISDVPRGILIKGKNTKVTDLFGTTIENNAYDFGDKVNHSFSTSIYYPIKHTFDTIVSSYMSTYAQWVKISDVHSGEKFWLPVSGYVAGNMAATDGTYGPWYAAAGLRRGVISGVLDYALSPNGTQRTDLYKICINSVPKIPNYGVTIWGLRTMSKAASAFDQNTCRRTFLYMEKKVKQTLRYYIFEPNTSYTRLNVVNDIDPFLEKVKNAGGIYSYTLVCDHTNNTPEVINNGDLAVSIAAAPTRTAENIVVEFTANKYTDEVSASESVS